jgi:Hypothetical glycosyl hydrolase family 15
MLLSFLSESGKQPQKSERTHQLTAVSPNFCRKLRFWSCFCAILIGTAPIYSEAQAAPETCGAPELRKDSETALLLWKDCFSGTWTVTATGGGASTTQTYEGSISATDGATMVAGSRLEPNDVLDASDPMSIFYTLKVSGKGVDAFDFAFPDSADMCFSITTSDSKVLVGPNRSPVTPPLNLRTMEPCVSASQGCGRLSYDKSSEQGTYLWRDCKSGQWHLRVTGGGAKAVNYGGRLNSDQPIAFVTPFSLEKGDLLDSSEPGQFDYSLRVAGSGQDGVDFSLTEGASACLDTGGNVVVGPDRTVVASPFDLQTLGGCGVSMPDVPPEPAPAPSRYSYLEDANTTDSVRYVVDSDLGDRPFPRITTGPLKKRGTPEQFSKYDVIAAKAMSFSWMEKVQAINPETTVLRIHCPQEYQGWKEKKSCLQGNGMPFDRSGPATANCQIYSGHWLYAPGTTLSSAVSAGATTLQVADASLFNKGRYVVIYDGEPGSFSNAEHAQVIAVNTYFNTLTLAKRGYKSTARSHAAGAIVAEHVIGNGEAQAPENWVFNLSTASPRDSSGRQVNQVMAEWLANNYNKDGKGNPSPVRVDGILFDSDFHFIMSGGYGRRPDVNNDLVQDNGLSASGENLWGEGLDAFYRTVRERLPDVLLVGGVIESRGYTSLNGTQLEGWPQRNVGKSAAEDYREINGRLSTYTVQMHHGEIGPRYSEAINKMPTRLYPSSSNPNVPTNAAFRFSFGLMLLDDGYYGQQNWHVTDPWWDEYAVDVAPGSPTYGHAIPSTPDDESLIRSHKGWMGFPMGPRYRVYDPTLFAPERSLMPDGNFDSGLGAWESKNVTVGIDAASENRLEGSGSMHISEHLKYEESEHGASAIGSKVTLTGGAEYTLAFAVKSNAIRTIQVAIAGQKQRLHVPDTWTRQVVTFTAPNTGNYRLRFNVGRESSDVWIDSVYLFEGNADVFRRDFDNAVVVVNATPSERTVSLEGTFKRIQGTGQDPINDGATVTQVTIAPYDSAILVRP